MPSEISRDLSRFIRSLPKTETHLHIEGALPFELLRQSMPEKYNGPPASWDRAFRYASFADFEHELLSMAGDWYVSPEHYHEAARIVFHRLYDMQNVRYVETSFASGMLEWKGLDGAAVAEAVKSAAPRGLTVRVFMGIHHDGYEGPMQSVIDGSLEWKHLDGLDLHGTETTPLGEWAADLWANARAAGKETKAHAGEFDGPQFVRRVVEELGVKRIQHGVRAIEDPDLISHLADADVTLDMCPISNTKLRVTESYDSHPIRDLMAAGVRCTVSTDDPVVFGNTLYDEYVTLASDLSFSRAELAQVARNGFEVARMAETERLRHMTLIDRLVAGDDAD